jgi:hypothetical protein
MRLLRSLIQDLELGHESGFRVCCIAWFVLVFHPLCEVRPRLKERYTRWLWWHLPGDWAPYNVQYIPCPMCIMRGSFDKTSNPFAVRVPDVTLQDYEELISAEDFFDDPLFPDEEFH